MGKNISGETRDRAGAIAVVFTPEGELVFGPGALAAPPENTGAEMAATARTRTLIRTVKLGRLAMLRAVGGFICTFSL
jgi:hypothetical protein